MRFHGATCSSPSMSPLGVCGLPQDASLDPLGEPGNSMGVIGSQGDVGAVATSVSRGIGAAKTGDATDTGGPAKTGDPARTGDVIRNVSFFSTGDVGILSWGHMVDPHSWSRDGGRRGVTDLNRFVRGPGEGVKGGVRLSSSASRERLLPRSRGRAVFADRDRWPFARPRRRRRDLFSLLRASDRRSTSSAVTIASKKCWRRRPTRFGYASTQLSSPRSTQREHGRPWSHRAFAFLQFVQAALTRRTLAGSLACRFTSADSSTGMAIFRCFFSRVEVRNTLVVIRSLYVPRMSRMSRGWSQRVGLECTPLEIGCVVDKGSS